MLRSNTSISSYNLTTDIGYEITEIIEEWKRRVQNAPEFKEVDYKVSNIIIGVTEIALITAIIIFIVATDLPIFYKQSRTWMQQLRNKFRRREVGPMTEI